MMWQWVHNRHVPSPCSVSSLFPFLPPSEASPPGFPRTWHARWTMIARTVLALLRLDGLIVHVHVVLDRRHIIMPQQLLQAKRVITQHQVPHRKGMPQDMRADALVGDARSLAKTREEHFYAILGERRAC